MYVGVRDELWNTIQPNVVASKVVEDPHGFRATVSSQNRDGAIAFDWTVTITGSSAGSVGCELDGVCAADFNFAKIGICVHHPMEDAGRRFTGLGPSGPVAGHLPDLIGPQLHDGDVDLPLFPPIHDLVIHGEDGISIRFVFTGDRFEMEDQRNWADASFKTYSTPADMGYLFRASTGQVVRQTVRTSLERGSRAATSTSPVADGVPAFVHLSAATGLTLGSIGVGGMHHFDEDTRIAAGLLSSARLNHVRGDVRLHEPAWRMSLEHSTQASAAAGCPLELAIFLDSTPEAELAALASELKKADIDLVRILVLRRGEEATRPVWLAAARGRMAPLMPSCQIFGGTDGHFAEINRNRSALGGADGLAYSLTPQVHAYDDLSLFENIGAQPETVRTLRSFAGNQSIAVSPITLRPRPPVPGPEPLNDAGQRRVRLAIDPRQPTLLAAAWTVASLAALAGAGVDSMTYFEAFGPTGVIDVAGSQGETAPSVSPAYHMLSDAAELCGRPLLSLQPADSRVAGFAVRTEHGTCAVLANITGQPIRMRVGGWTGEAFVRLLTAEKEAAKHEPAVFRNDYKRLSAENGIVQLRLGAYESARIQTTRPPSASVTPGRA